MCSLCRIGICQDGEDLLNFQRQGSIGTRVHERDRKQTVRSFHDVLMLYAFVHASMHDDL